MACVSLHIPNIRKTSLPKLNPESADVKITCNEHAHPNGATSYKISYKNYDIVYTTDCEHAEDNLSKDVIEFAAVDEAFIFLRTIEGFVFK